MRKLIYAAVTCLLAAFLLGGSQFIMPIFEPPVATATVFTPLHLYFLSPAGSDSNSGLDAAHPWATPNHSVVCGDVIIAAAGHYTNPANVFTFGFGTVSNCPSTSGGIDGAGGIYFATVLCGGVDLEACQIDSNAAQGIVAATGNNNWAMEGFKCNGTGNMRCYEAQSCSGAGGTLHHFAVINSISYNALQAFDTDDCGVSGQVVGSTSGADYVAAVGLVAQNSVQDGTCLAAIDIVGPGVKDTAAGTHYYVRDVFSYNGDANPFCTNYEAASVSFTPGGSLGATTYFVQYVYTASGCSVGGPLFSDCRSKPSVETSISVPANNLLVVNSPPSLSPSQSIITGWQAYVSTTSGNEQCQNGTGNTTVIGSCQAGTGNVAIGTNWTEPSTGLISPIGAPGGGTDIEAFMFDTWDFHNVVTKGVIANSIGFGSDRMCIQMFQQGNADDVPTINIYNNTCFRSNLRTGGNNYNGEINITEGGRASNALTWAITLQNNIAYQPLSASVGGGAVSAFALGAGIASFTHGGTGFENIYRANNSMCVQPTFCNGTNDIGVFSPGTSGNLGTNFYENPNFANTTDLLNNQSGVPNCAGKVNVTQCMGYDPGTQTLTTLSVIGDLRASCAHCSGKGYQLPSTTCAPNPDYPTWLKGVVYLHWNPSTNTITQLHDLVTTPCAM